MRTQEAPPLYIYIGYELGPHSAGTVWETLENSFKSIQKHKRNKTRPNSEKEPLLDCMQLHAAALVLLMLRVLQLPGPLAPQWPLALQLVLLGTPWLLTLRRR